MLVSRASLRLRSSASNNISDNGVKIKRVAWAFLLPVGGVDTKDDTERCNVGLLPEWKPSSGNEAHDSVEKRSKGGNALSVDTGAAEPGTNIIKHDLSVRLQLHAFSSDNCFESMQRTSIGWPPHEGEIFGHEDPSYPDGIPEVYFQWRRRTYCKIDSALQVSLGPAPLPDDFYEIDGEEILSHGTETEEEEGAADKESHDGKRASVGGVLKSHRYQQHYERHVNRDTKSAISKRARTEIEPCIVPDKLLHTIDAGPCGVMALSFAHGGVLLAAAGESSLSQSLEMDAGGKPHGRSYLMNARNLCSLGNCILSGRQSLCPPHF